jgi:hypothetical protein
MNHEQRGSPLNSNWDGSNRMPSLLASFVGAIRINQTLVVVKDQSRVFE